jgi:nucleoside-diphosphate-sugar epimerase
VPRLVARGHEVTGMTRKAERRELLRGLGATPVVADALDAEAVARAVAEHEPEVVVHQLTDLAGRLGGRDLARTLAPTNRLRVEATDHLLAAARAIGARRFVAQSYVGSGVAFPAEGPAVRDESAPIDPHPLPSLRPAVEAIRHLEESVLGATWTEGVVLRYGSFYGPFTSFAPGGETFEAIRARKLPLVGDGAGVWSFVHIEDAAEATVLAVERGRRGVYHVVDDDPAPVAAWLPAAAAAWGAPSPLRVPRWVGRLLAGEAVVRMMIGARGAANAATQRELGWQPRRRSWREGFRELASPEPGSRGPGLRGQGLAEPGPHEPGRAGHLSSFPQPGPRQASLREPS